METGTVSRSGFWLRIALPSEATMGLVRCMRLSLVFDEGPGPPGVRDGSQNRLSAGVEIDLDRFGISLHRPWLRSQVDVDPNWMLMCALWQSRRARA
jgi:hypothetical protein